MGGLSFIYDDFCFWEGGKGSLNIVCPGCVCGIVHQDALCRAHGGDVFDVMAT